MAGIFERMSTIIKSNVNDLMDKYEDPEKMIDQTILDATKEYSKAVDQATETFANEKLEKKKVDDYNADVEKWHTIAKKALKAGNEDDAKTALANEQKAQSKADVQQVAYEATKEAADKTREKIEEMENQIRLMKDKSDQIKATSAAAKATQAASRVKVMGIDDSAFDTFKRMEEKANKELAKAQVKDEMVKKTKSEKDAEKELIEKYNGTSQTVDDALEALKREIEAG